MGFGRELFPSGRMDPAIRKFNFQRFKAEV
jgi:hypothetical protein